MLKLKRWSRPATIAFSVLFVAILCFSFLPSPVQIGQFGVASADTSLVYQVSASTDDVCVYLLGTTWVIDSLSTTAIPAGTFNQFSITYEGGGYRFPNVAIPAGANITSAYLSFKAAENASGTTVKTYIVGDKPTDADSETFSTLTDFQNRRGTDVGGANNNYRTTAEVAWDSIGAWTANTWYDSPSITSVIQELIGNANWASGNDLTLFWDDFDKRSSEGNVKRMAYSWDNANPTTLAAKLYIEFTGPPTIATLAATSITATSATLNGNVTSLGDYGNVTSYGFVLSTSAKSSPGNVSPSAQTTYTAGNWTWTGVQYAAGQTFNSNGNVTGLTYGTAYYFRAAGYSTYGWVYGSELTFGAIQPPSEDAQVSQYYPTTNYGSDTNYSLFDLGDDYHRRILLRLPTSNIPAGATVSVATLSIYLSSYETTYDAAKEIQCKRVTSSWNEGTVTWNTAPTVTDTSQATATTVHAITGWVNFDVLTLTQDAIANRNNILDVRLSFTTETGFTAIPYFWSSEYTINTSLCPKLVVTYLPPDISNTPSSKNFGVVQPSQTYWAIGAAPSWPLADGNCTETVTNNSSFAINILYSMSHMTGGTTWTIGANPANNVFTVKVFKSGAGNITVCTILSIASQEVIHELAAGNHIHWEFALYTPTNSPQFADGTLKSGNMTLTAEVH